MVHRRSLDGETLVLGNHGALWGNAMTWWDHDTGSIWSQPIGEAIAGPRKGATLDALPVVFTSWEAWRTTHPQTLALDVPAGESGFDLEEMLLVVDFGGDAAGWHYTDVRDAGVVNDTVAGVALAVVTDPSNPDQWSVLSRRLDDRTVTLEVREGAIVDAETGTSWDPQRGIGLEGPLAGEVLDSLPGFTAFPGDFDTFWPDGRIWRP